MRVNLFSRLLLAFSGVAITALVIAALLWRWQFSAGFLDYVNRAEQAQVERVADLLVERHASNGALAQLRDPEWRRLWRGAPGFAPAAGPDSGRGNRPPRVGPGPRSPPPPSTNPVAPPRAPQPPARPAPGEESRGLERRVALFDDGGRRIAGPELPAGDIEEVLLEADGQIIGLLRRVAMAEIGGGPEQAFLRSQNRLVIASLLVLAAITTLFAWLFARRLVAPVRSMARGARRLAEGRYETRLGLERSDELGELARDFDHLARQLEDAESSRRRWMADIAHELRTPLTVLQGEIEALVDGIRQPEPGRLRALEAETACLARLVGDLHTLALSDRGALDYRPTRLDFARLLAGALSGLEDLARERKLALHAFVPNHCPVRGDPDRLLQLCNNLLGNALMHTDPGGEVRVTLEAGAAVVKLTIDDSAPGVPLDDLPRLGTPLYRASADRSRRTGGSGLGLAIACRIAQAHDAQLRFSPSALGGLCVTLELPLHE